MKTIISLYTFVLVAFIPGISVASAKQEVKPTMNIGIYAPFSEKNAFIGRNILAAMEMGRDQLHSSPINYSFYTLDQIPANKNAAQTLQKFISVHHLNVLVTEGSENGVLVSPLAKENNIIHFSMANEPKIADGKNNFLAWRPAAGKAAVSVKEIKVVAGKQYINTREMKPEFVSQFKQEYLNQPVIIAGYAFDIFNLYNQSAVLAMHANAPVSNVAIAQQINVLAAGEAVGSLKFDKKTVLSSKSEVKPVSVVG